MNLKGQQPIIIVKKRHGDHGHHGGAWKVAYADFVTAMMAFFLVMWLVGQSKAVKASVAGYFKDPGAFMAEQGRGILPGGRSVEVSPAPEAPASKSDPAAEKTALESAAHRIRTTLDGVPDFKTLKNQVEFSVTPDGLRIDLIEAENSSFFDSGSAVLKGESERILGVIARELGKLPNKVIIEGHTDSRQYTTSDRYSNWELSADRANAARRVVEKQGLSTEQISSVRGEADRVLKIPTDPLDPRNRRVSIVVRNRLNPVTN